MLMTFLKISSFVIHISMKVVLLKSIPGVGKAGVIIEAKEGHALNYLLPRGLAKAVTKQVEHERAAKATKALIHSEELQAFYAEAEGKIRSAGEVKLARKASDKGHLFGGVTERDIAGAVRDQVRVEVEAQHVRLRRAIKTVGTHTVDIRLGTISVPLQVVVEAG